MEGHDVHFIMLNNKIFRHTQVYLDHVLEPFGLSSGSLPYLFILEKHEGISQNQISRHIGNDKAMSARTIAKLIEHGLMRKEADAADSRAFCLFLTDAARKLLPKIHAEVHELVNLITENLTDEEKSVTLETMKKIFHNTQRLAGRGGNG